MIAKTMIGTAKLLNVGTAKALFSRFSYGTVYLKKDCIFDCS